MVSKFKMLSTIASSRTINELDGTLGTHALVDYSSSQSHYQNTKYQDGLTLRSALGTSLRRQTKGRQRGLRRLDPTRSARTRRVSPRRQTTTTAVDLGVCSNLCSHEKYFSAINRKIVSICELDS